MKFKTKDQRGVSIIGLLFALVVIGCLAVIGMKVVPSISEYSSIKKAIELAKASGSTVREIQLSFDKQADTSYISSIAGKDLEITRNGDQMDVSFAYQKKIPLVGPASLVIDYAGSTVKGTGK
jgi:type II secretory pathway pseudopilin PulG